MQYSPTSPDYPTIDDLVGGIISDYEEKHGTNNPLNVSALVICRNSKCRSPIPNYRTEQRRSGDEGPTIVAVCPKCHTSLVRNT